MHGRLNLIKRERAERGTDIDFKTNVENAEVFEMDAVGTYLHLASKRKGVFSQQRIPAGQSSTFN